METLLNEFFLHYNNNNNNNNSLFNKTALQDNLIIEVCLQFY